MAEKMFIATVKLKSGEQRYLSFYAESKALAVAHADHCVYCDPVLERSAQLLTVKHYPRAALNEAMAGRWVDQREQLLM